MTDTNSKTGGGPELAHLNIILRLDGGECQTSEV